VNQLVNIKPFKRSVFIEYPSIVVGNHFLDYDKDKETGDITVWFGRLHCVISPEPG